MPRACRGAVVAVMLALAGPTAASGQEAQGALAPMGVLTIDQDELYSRSAWGRRVQSEIEAAGSALAAENRAIETDLTAEERQLTEQRATMEADAFRELARAFDEKVTGIRQRQDQKERDLARQAEEGRVAFFRAAAPILAQLVQDRGAAVILDSRAVLLSLEGIDVTDEAIRRVDALLGADGKGGQPARPEAGSSP